MIKLIVAVIALQLPLDRLPTAACSRAKELPEVGQVLGTHQGVEVDRACHEQTRRAYHEQDQTNGDQEPKCGF